MAINYCDTVMFASVPLFPAFAAVGIAPVNDGWLAIVLVVPSIAVGIAIAWSGRVAVYSVVAWGLRNCLEIRTQWLQQMAFAPFVVWYVLGPLMISGIGLYGIYTASRWLAMHALAG